jgi:hypothetical protein
MDGGVGFCLKRRGRGPLERPRFPAQRRFFVFCFVFFCFFLLFVRRPALSSENATDEGPSGRSREGGPCWAFALCHYSGENFQFSPPTRFCAKRVLSSILRSPRGSFSFVKK